MTDARRTTERHLQLARYYLRGGPGLEGNYEKCAELAGFDLTPPRGTQAMEEALRRVQEELDMEERAGVDSSSGRGKPRDSDVEMLEQLLADAGGNNLDWSEILPVAQAVYAKIATGSLEANTGQVSALKDIVSRGEKALAEKSKGNDPRERVRVLVLPAITDGDPGHLLPQVPFPKDKR